MTQDEIIDMAKQSGFFVKDREAYSPSIQEDHEITPFLRTFAKLVAAKATAKEREACARVCEIGINNATDWDSSDWDQACENRAYHIRARGEA